MLYPYNTVLVKLHIESVRSLFHPHPIGSKIYTVKEREKFKQFSLFIILITPYIAPMQTSFHIISLISELKNEIEGGKIAATEFYKKERTAFLIIKNKKRLALAFQYHPTKSGVYLIPPSKIELKTKEKPWPIFKLDGEVITDIKQIGFDRFIEITLESNNKKKYLIIEAIGPNGNLWYLNSEYQKEATLRKKDFKAGDIYEIPQPQERLNPITITAEELVEKQHEKQDLAPIYLLERYVSGFNLTLAREVLHRAEFDDDSFDSENAKVVIKKIGEVIQLFKRFDMGYLYQVKGIFEAYPFKLASIDKQPEKFKSLSLAVKEMTERKSEKIEAVDEEKVIRDAVKKSIKKLEKRVKNIESDITQAEDFEVYKLYGDLLQINFEKIKKGMTAIVVENQFVDSLDEIEISLNETMTPHENVELYFKKHRKGREGLELLKRRLAITKDEVKSLKAIADELDLHFNNAKEKYASEIKSLLPKEQLKAQVAERLPYREYQLSTGLTIYIGRDGADNDRTTFDFAKPYELWFHASQCPGSHVVMKFPNKNFEPSKQEIAETAAIAAYHSKARNDSMVPVIYTERKYVRKPRKAKPGLVTVEREKSVMVEPKEAE